MASTGAIIVPPYDLTDLTTVKTWISGSGQPSPTTTDDVNIQRCITANGVYVLWRTGQIDSNGDIPQVSPFIQPQFYNEWYDGNGNERMFLRHSPIRSVAALIVSGAAISQSAGFPAPGFVIDSSGRSLVIVGRSSGPGLGGYGTYQVAPLRAITFGGFARGTMNINVQYVAGYSVVPYDLADASTQFVALNYKRRAWIDQRSISLPMGGGTTVFRDWISTPYIESVMENYSRKSFN